MTILQSGGEIDHPDDIVISGISGVFPGSENIQEFGNNLIAGNDLIKSINRYDVVLNIGAVDTIDRFDHSFFHITRQQAQGMTIGSRILLEKTFEAILDAGYNPQQIKGKNIGVFCGIWDASDDGDPAKESSIADFNQMTGAFQFMAANRISNWLDLHGPSCGVNTACSSSMYALDMAIKYIKTGQCEGAIVCSPNFCFSNNEITVLNPLTTTTGFSAPFSAEAVGYVRAEAVVAILIQKRKDARRVYANIIHSLLNCDGFQGEGFMTPSIKEQKKLYEQFYKEINIDPLLVNYIEAHATGTPVGDVVEGRSIEEFFGNGRTTPLKIGTVKSNIGHSESVAALCSIAKMIISFETGIIPPNLRYKTPNPHIKGLLNGKLEVVAKPTPLAGKYFAINSKGMGGANGHLLLTPHNKLKKSNNFKVEGIPRMVTVSGRTAEAVEHIFNDIEKNYKDEEYLGLLHEIFRDDISGHLQRGFIILDEDKPLVKSQATFSGEKRPVWFVFSGMGSQWPTMGKSLMNIPSFADSIRKSHEVLTSKDIDLIRIITENDPKLFDNVTNSFVGIAAIQIALVDVLTSIGIQPDGIIGHSVGELGCGYADGCFTAEQMILAAHSRGEVTPQTELVHGTMAAVGAGYETVKQFIPDGIEIACHNSPSSCTISGPTQMVLPFIETLKEKNIFVRRINSGNIAYHSRYIAPFGPQLNSHMKKIIPEPKLRSKKWICTSVPESKWDSDLVKYSSAEYHANNLISPVLFEEGCRHIPENAIIIEISPHSLLIPILQQSLPKTTANIALIIKNQENGVEFFLNSLGRLYEAGCVPKLGYLYPPVEFPVSRSTPMISPLIKWQHAEQWSVGRLTNEDIHTERNFTITSFDDKYEYIKHHVIDGRNLFPGVGYLWLVLETIATIRNTIPTKLAVVFENIRFERATNVPEKGNLKFHVAIHMATNNFEVTEGGAAVATGSVRVLDNIHKEVISLPSSVINNITSNSQNCVYLNTRDFYKELRLRGYEYEKIFKKVIRVNCEGTFGEISWCDNFVSFMDTMAQIQLLSIDTRELLVPTSIRKIVIDFAKHFQILESLDKENPTFPVYFYPQHRLMCSGGIQMKGFSCTAIARQKNQAEPILEKYQFVPYINDEEMELNLAITHCVHIALENLSNKQVKTYELLDHNIPLENAALSPEIFKALIRKPLIQANVNILTNMDNASELQVPKEITISNEKLPQDKSVSLIALSNIRNKIDMLENIQEALKDDGFILTKELLAENNETLENMGFHICFSRPINDIEKILLLAKKVTNTSIYRAVKLQSDSYDWITDLQEKLLTSDSKQNENLVIYAEKDSTSGILGFFNCMRREENGKNLRCVFVMDEGMPDFSLETPFYSAQLEKNLCHNVYKNGHWGCYSFVTLDPVENIKTTHAICTLQERGNFSSFRWIEGPLNSTKQKYTNGNSSAYVYYSSLNFRDVMLSIGKISALDTSSYSRLMECHLGIEFSGKDKNGTRIMGMVKHKGIATMVETIPELTWTVPDHMTLEEAATIPVIYTTVLYAFFCKMSLQKGSIVLIHAGSGGIGQAAIHICLHYKCTIFTTVGTKEKVEFIRRTFPQIPEGNIGNSRDTSFEQMIIQQTNGRGVDVVLNSLAEEKLQASVRCLATDGHFLEIGKFDIFRNNSLELGHFARNISFHSVQLDETMQNNKNIIYELRGKVQEWLDQGIIKPINRTIFPADDVESAFRYMAAGKHIGKILIEIQKEVIDSKSKSVSTEIKVKPQIICQEYNSYIIIGGLGGIGMELADWLIIRGARNIVLSSRTGLKNGYQSYRIKMWRSYGVQVIITTENIAKESGIRNILQMANSLGPVVGIFNLAMVMKNDPFLKQTEESFKISVEPKSIATLHLDNLSRKMCPHLEHFVVFSSAASGLGNAEQTNYGYANSIMERICEKRLDHKLPSLVIQWGAVGDVGLIADSVEQNISITIGGTLQQKIGSCLETLNLLMNQSSCPILSSMVVAEKRGFDFDIIDKIANILGIKDLKTINQSWTLSELGMDSILEMELKQMLESESEFGVFYSAEDIRTMTFAKLRQIKEEKEKTFESGGKQKIQLRITTNEEIIKKPVIRLPLDENDISKPILIDKTPTIFAFPGVQGLATTMEPIFKSFPGQVLCFQYHLDEIVDLSFEKLRHYFANYILENHNSDEEFCLVGHSLGGLLALEVANTLEAHGKIGSLYLIDSSPLWAQKQIVEETAKQELSNEQIIQNRACLEIVQTVSLTKVPTEFIQTADTWESKKKLCFSIAPKGSFREEFADQVFDRVYSMVKTLLKYQAPDILLESSCVLIRCATNTFEIDNDYGLSQYFKNPIQIRKVDAKHGTILQHSKTSEILTEFMKHAVEGKEEKQ